MDVVVCVVCGRAGGRRGCAGTAAPALRAAGVASAELGCKVCARARERLRLCWRWWFAVTAAFGCKVCAAPLQALALEALR